MFTYETKNTNTPLETFEWDNTWLEQIPNKEKSRVLYIGDSISCGTRRIATAVSEGKLLFDGFGTSKALDNPFFKESLITFAKQEEKRKAVLFNNGLHGWHLSNDEYEKLYDEMLSFLIKEFDGTPIFVILTTSVTDIERNGIVEARNEIVKKLAKKHGLGVIDLYTVSVNIKEFQDPDGVHFYDEGYNALAKEIVKNIIDL